MNELNTILNKLQQYIPDISVIIKQHNIIVYLDTIVIFGSVDGTHDTRVTSVIAFLNGILAGKTIFSPESRYYNNK